ncbi:MAG: SDR family NAD(P)-dependent oxidoreductase, partial [Flavonifractor plautii]
MKELENKVALVSSSTRGIGLACAKALAAQGAAVYLGVRRLEAGQQIADELIAAGGRAGVVFFDASREESFSGMVDEVAAKEGRLDILVNNFGSTDVKTDLDVVNGPSEDFFRIVNTNLK